MASLRGHFLVASPHLADPNFYHTVVLLVQHDEQGAMGLVLNRPTGKTVRDAWKLVTDEPCSCDDAIFLGGPVRGPITVVHAVEDKGDLEILPGVYYTAEGQMVSELMQLRIVPTRVFVGYSGWTGGQLESELKAGGWLTTAANLEEIFAEPLEQWQQVARRIGRDFLTATIKPKFIPDEPNLN